MLAVVDHIRFGLQMRALRVRAAIRQVDLAVAANLSRPKISRIERGLIAGMTLGDLDRAATGLGATLELRLRWRGEHLDRLLDAGHARLVELVVSMLQASGWEVAVEVSYSIWGERGSIDILAFHAASRTILVIEVKSVVPDSQATLHGLDRKSRLARQIAAERGWDCREVARLLIVGASATARRRIARLSSTYDAALPARGAEVRRWLRRPSGSLSGLLFLAYAQEVSTRSAVSGRERVRRRSEAQARTR